MILSVKAHPPDPKIAARFSNVPDLLSMWMRAHLSLKLALTLVIEHLLRSKPKSLMKMLRE